MIERTGKWADVIGENAREFFQSLSLEERISFVNYVEECERLEEFKELFATMSVENLSAVLKGLENKTCQLIMGYLNSAQRVDMIYQLYKEENDDDLNAAIKFLSSSELTSLLSAVSQVDQAKLFKLLIGEKQIEFLHLLMEEKYSEQVQIYSRDMDAADLADFLEDLKEDDLRVEIFRLFPISTQATILVEMEASKSKKFIHRSSPEEMGRWFGEMAADNAVDFLDELNADNLMQVMGFIDEDVLKPIQQLLKYEDDSAGHMMTPETCSMSSTATVLETKNALKKLENTDPIHYVYVVQPDSNILLGHIPLIQLFKEENQKKLAEILESDIEYSTPDEDQEAVALRFRKYNLWVMPVINDDMELIGRITVDDVMDVLREEADEDLAHLVGAPDIEEEDESTFIITKKRLPWLLITMIAGLINSVIIKKMMDLTSVQTLAIFVPCILAMGGNTGMQSSAIAVRGIALGQSRYNRLMSVLMREVKVGAMLGISCGICCAVVVFLVLSTVDTDFKLSSSRLAMTIGIAMLCSMTFASFYGGIAPIILHRLGADPAVASGPFVTTSNDISASLIYFLCCMILLL